MKLFNFISNTKFVWQKPCSLPVNVIKDVTYVQCCQLSNFVAISGDFPDPFGDLISKKRLATNLATFLCHLVDYCVDKALKKHLTSRSAVHVTTDLTRAEYSEGCGRLLSTHTAAARARPV